MILAQLIEESYQFHTTKHLLTENENYDLIEEAFFQHITDTFNKFKDKIINLDPFSVRKTEVQFDPSRRKFIKFLGAGTAGAAVASNTALRTLSKVADDINKNYNPFYFITTGLKDANNLEKNSYLFPDYNSFTARQIDSIKTSFRNTLNLRDFYRFNIRELKKDIDEYKNILNEETPLTTKSLKLLNSMYFNNLKHKNLGKFKSRNDLALALSFGSSIPNTVKKINKNIPTKTITYTNKALNSAFNFINNYNSYVTQGLNQTKNSMNKLISTL